MQKIILFDLDGTLIDSTTAILHCFYKTFDLFGYKKKDEEEIKALIGHPLDVMYKELGVKDDEVEKYVKAYKECYRKISTKMTSLLPFAKESLELASKVARLGIVTTKTARYSKELLEHLGVMKYFQTLIGRENVINPKPHPEPILLALDKMCVKTKHDVWMIGDTYMDLECAKNAGVNGIGVLSGYGKEEDLRRYGDIVVSDALEAVKRLV